MDASRRLINLLRLAHGFCACTLTGSLSPNVYISMFKFNVVFRLMSACMHTRMHVYPGVPVTLKSSELVYLGFSLYFLRQCFTQSSSSSSCLNLPSVGMTRVLYHTWGLWRLILLFYKCWIFFFQNSMVLILWEARAGGPQLSPCHLSYQCPSTRLLHKASLSRAGSNLKSSWHQGHTTAFRTNPRGFLLVQLSSLVPGLCERLQKGLARFLRSQSPQSRKKANNTQFPLERSIDDKIP